MRDDGDQFDGTRILFWRDKYDPKKNPLGALVTAFVDVFMPSESLRDPFEWIVRMGARNGPAHADRELVGRVLAQGKRGVAYMGYANCRICGRQLGTADLYGFGFIWPEKAEHYVLDHDVWTPECDDLLAAVKARMQRGAR